MLNPGELRDRVVVLKRSPTADSQGGRAVSWVDLITSSATRLTRLAARVQAVPGAGTEQRQATKVQSQVSYQVVMRYRPDISALMRLQWRPYRATADKTLEIHAVTPADGGREFLELACAEVV